MAETLKNRLHKDRKKMKYTTLPDITRRVIEARQGGTPEDVIEGFLKKRGYTPASFERAVNNQTKKENEKGVGDADWSFWDTVTDGLQYFNKATDSLITGRTFGLAIPARAVGRWAAKNMPWRDESEAETYSESVKAIQAEDKKFADENPNVAMGTEMVGAMASGPEIVGGLVKKVPALMPVAGQTVRNIGKGVALHGPVGMVEGGGIAAAKDENVYLGVGAGGIGGALGELAMPILKWAVKKFTTPIKKKLGKPVTKEPSTAEIKGEQMLEEVDKKDGVTLVQKDMRLQEYEALGLGDEVMEVDLLGKKGQGLAGTIMRKGDKIPDDAEKKLVARAGKVRQYLYDFLQEATGGTRMSLKQADDVFRKTAKEESTEVYNKAFYTKGKFRTVSDTDLNALFMMPEFKKAYKRAIYLAKHDTPPVTLAPIPTKKIKLPNGKTKIVEAEFPEGHEFPVYALDKVKKALSSKFGKDSIFHPDSNVKALAGQMTQHKNTMLDVIEKYNGDYKQARDIYAGNMELKDATEMGKKLFDSEDAFDKFYEHSTKLRTNAERAEFRNAAFNVLSKKIESSSVNPKGMSTFFMNDQNMKKLELLIPDPEKRARFLRQNELLSGFVDVKNKIVGGSPTAEKLAADAGEEEMSQSIRAVSNIANRNPAGLAQQATDLVAGTQRGARLDEAGKKMYQQKTPNIQAAHEDSLLTNQVLKSKMRRGLLDQGAGAAGGASLMNSLLQ